MTDTLISRRDLDFLLYEVLGAEQLCARARYQEHSRETFDAAINTADQLARRYFAPHNAKADAQEPSFDGQKVTMIPEVKEAFGAFAEAGFLAGGMDFEQGGMQLPATVLAACMGHFTAANPSTAGYPFLTVAAANLINTFGSEDQKQRFLRHMLSGRFTGTMALTEPQAGSSLADITTQATPTDDGHYLIAGNKIFISGGDHELSDNIVHLVLAKIKGAPAGVKGISLFIVPKFLVDAEGNPIRRNDVALAGLFHKMGYRGTTSTALNFGENGHCVGYLVGEPHQGLKYMFHMMNEARIGVGFGAALIGYRGYLHALEYARSRPQGRLPSSRDPIAKQVPIIQHADVRRMLLAQKAYAEGGVALCLYASSLVDDSETLADAEARTAALDLLDLLTPIVKAWPSEYGPKANDLAIQVHGGAGYTREYPVEQCYRDNRLNPIHEGTNGIQALDLLGRKVWQKDSAGLKRLSAEIQASIKQAASLERCASLAQSLGKALATAGQITLHLGQSLAKQGPDLTLANASCYLSLMSKVVVGWIWLRQAIVAEQALAGATGETEQAFYQGKLQAAQYFMGWELPEIERDAAILSRLDRTCFDMKDEWF